MGEFHVKRITSAERQDRRDRLLPDGRRRARAARMPDEVEAEPGGAAGSAHRAVPETVRRDRVPSGGLARGRRHALGALAALPRLRVALDATSSTSREVERYDDVLNDATDRLIEELDRVTRENMTEAVDRFRLAPSKTTGIMPFDFRAPSERAAAQAPPPRASCSEAPSPVIELHDVRGRRGAPAGRGRRTPVLTSRTLDELTGARGVLSPRTCSASGAFKFRGAYNALSQLTPEQRARGVLRVLLGQPRAGASRWRAAAARRRRPRS